MAQQTMEKTSVEWLKKELEDYGDSCLLSLNWNKFDELCEQAKQMEKEQSEKYAEFCVECDRGGIKLLDFNDYIKL